MTPQLSGDHERDPGDAPSMVCRLARSTAMPSTVLADRAARWYATAARDLPWRRPGTSAWAVLTSEVMLQQTPAARVAPVYVEWMNRWPTPADLVAEPGGIVPDDLSVLLGLPGVGTYTARAVAAFAYGQRHPVVDTNVRRLV